MKLIAEEDSATKTVIVKIDGSIDTVTAPDLEEELSKYYDKVSKILLDFKDVSYISSAGLRVLLKADSATGSQGNIILKNTNADVLEVLNLTGFSEIITIQE